MYSNAFSIIANLEQLYENSVVTLPHSDAQHKALTHHLFIENLYKQILEVANGLTSQEEATLLSQYQDTIDKVYEHFQVVRQGILRNPDRAPDFVLVNRSTWTRVQIPERRD
jgi:hypothetical protein